MFCHALKLPVDTMEFYTDSKPELFTILLALYAQHLASGQNLVSMTLRCSTIRTYIQNVSSFLQLFPTNPYDYRLTHRSSKETHPYLLAVYKEIERYESVPDKREPFTLDMLKALRAIVATEYPDEEDTLLPALLDWFEIGLFLGLRLSEWAQHSYQHNLAQPQLNKFGDPTAFLPRDIQCSDVDDRNPRGFCAGWIPERMSICFRTQKNGQDGEKKLTAKNPRQGGRCCNSAMYRVLARHQRLCGDMRDAAITPLSVFWDDEHKEVRLITADKIEAVMRRAAKKAYKLNPKHAASRELLQKWTSHSLRVGACTLLYARGNHPIVIKNLLRWRSDAFMDYLRNLGVTALNHVADVDAIDMIPNFL